MLAGKRFRLETETSAVETVDGKRVAIMIPAQAIIKVISDQRHGETMMDVLWDGRTVSMFPVDVEERGTELAGKAIREG